VILVFGIPDYDPVADGWLRDAGSTATLIWDRQGWLSRARDAGGVVSLSPSRKIYLANVREAAEEAGTADDAAALERQPPAGFSDAVVKLGADGAVVVDGTMSDPAIAHVAAFQVVVATTIGAGDVFAGAIAAGLALGKTLAEAGVLGCAAAAVAIESGDNLLDGSAVVRIRELVEERAALSDT
jgi:sugar/nucleoside kinase (ribokinase family)